MKPMSSSNVFQHTDCKSYAFKCLSNTQIASRIHSTMHIVIVPMYFWMRFGFACARMCAGRLLKFRSYDTTAFWVRVCSYVCR